MQRLPFVMKIAPERRAEVIAALRGSWGEIDAALRRAGAENFSVWSIQDFLFCYGEYPDGVCPPAACGEKSVEMIPQKALLPSTGYIHGGCSPIGMKKAYPTFIDETAQLFDTICVSAGKIGAQVEVAPDALLGMTGAVYAELTD